MRLQVLGNLHRQMDALTVYDVTEQAVDVVIQPGDSDGGGRGVAWAAQIWPDKPVLYICGNHEPYGSDIETACGSCRKAAAGMNVRVLEREAVTLAGVRFLRATL